MPYRVKDMLTLVGVFRLLTGRTADMLYMFFLKAVRRDIEVGSEQFKVIPDFKNRAEKSAVMHRYY